MSDSKFIDSDPTLQWKQYLQYILHNLNAFQWSWLHSGLSSGSQATRTYDQLKIHKPFTGVPSLRHVSYSCSTWGNLWRQHAELFLCFRQVSHELQTKPNESMVMQWMQPNLYAQVLQLGLSLLSRFCFCSFLHICTELFFSFTPPIYIFLWLLLVTARTLSCSYRS